LLPDDVIGKRTSPACNKQMIEAIMKTGGNMVAAKWK